MILAAIVSLAFFSGLLVEGQTPRYPQICPPNGTACPPDPAGHCVWYGECGNPDADDTFHILNCPYDGPGKPLGNAEYLDKLAYSCPHFYNDLGPDPNQWPLCCEINQVDALYENFVLPESLLVRCPTCLDNFKKQFCDLTCRPDQSLFLDPVIVNWTVGGIELIPGSGDPASAIETVTFYMAEEFANTAYDSCKDVVNPATSGPALTLLCGFWGTALCTPERWFDYMGDTANGYSPFLIDYNLTATPPPGLYSLNQVSNPCNKNIDGTDGGCSCTDCEASCVPPEFPPPQEPLMIGSMPAENFIALWIFVFLVAVFVTFLAVRGMKRHRRNRKQFII